MDISRVIETTSPSCEELPAAPRIDRHSFTPAASGTPSLMNRLDLVFPSSSHPAPDTGNDLTWSPPGTESSIPDVPQTKTAELITVQVKPGASIRRLRNHRCAWPRRF